MNTVILKRGESVVATAMPVAADGSPSKVEKGSATASVSSAAVTADEIVENSDGSISTRFHFAEPGEAQVTFSADADLGEGVKSITGIGTITCLADEAASFDVNFASPEAD